MTTQLDSSSEGESRMLGNVVRMSEAPTWESPAPHLRSMTLMFERDITPTRNMMAGVVRIPPGHEQQKLSVHENPESEEIYLVLSGSGRFILGDDQADVEAGTAVYVAPQQKHRAINTGQEDLVLYYVNAPAADIPVGGYQNAVAGWKKVR